MKSLVILSISCFFLFACDTPKLLPESKMKVLVWSLLKDSYDSATSSFKFAGKFTDEDLAPMEQVFKQNNVSRQDFYYTFENYQQDPGKLKILMDSVIAYGGRDMSKPSSVKKPVASRPKSALE